MNNNEYDSDAIPGEAEVTTQDLATLTAETVNRYLSLKNMERACEACGHQEWELEGVDPESRRTHVVAHRLVFGKNKYFVYVPMSCANCGNTRFINVSYIFKALENMEVDDGKNR